MWLIAVAMAGCIASGERPFWRLCGAKADLILHIEGEQPLRLRAGTWRDTPRGRELVAHTPAGLVSLVAVFGRCRGDRWEQERDGRGFAVLTLPGRRVLRGCMSGGGAVYPG